MCAGNVLPRRPGDFAGRAHWSRRHRRCNRLLQKPQPSLPETCGAEVQKGNAPEERKLQRLFRNGEATRMIKRCNDFGAGGVSVSIGELADGLEIDLNRVPKKYDGLDGTELAISESQERMAVVVAASDVDRFLELAARGKPGGHSGGHGDGENPRLRMHWNGNTIVDVSREFLNPTAQRSTSPFSWMHRGTMPSRSLAASWRIWRLLPQT